MLLLMREMKEETGLSNFKIIMPFIFEYQIEKPEEIRDATQINFLLKLLGDEKIKLSSEHQNFAWISRGDIKNQQLSRPVKKAILKAFELMEKFDLDDKVK